MREKLLLVVLQRRFNWLGYEPKNRCKVELELDDLLGTARAVQFLHSFTITTREEFQTLFSQYYNFYARFTTLFSSKSLRTKQTVTTRKTI